MSFGIRFYKNEVPVATAVVELQHPLKGAQRVWKQMGSEALCALEQTGRTGLQTVRYFSRRRFYEPKFLHLAISRKALKSFTGTSVPQD